MKEVYADKVIIGTCAISLKFGLTQEYMPETMKDRAILRAGGEVIVVADHTKFGRTATVLLAPTDSINLIITDAGVDEETIQTFRQRGIRIILA